MSSKLGSNITLEQAKSIGVIESFQPLGTNSGDGVFDGGAGTVTHTESGSTITLPNEESLARVGVEVPLQTFTAGRFITTCCWKTNFEPGGNAHTHRIGADGSDPIFNNRAFFAPHAGQSADGNVVVERNTDDFDDSVGTTKTAAVAYPQLTDGTILTSVVLDAGRDQTEFYIQKNPLVESPDATIDLLPDQISYCGASAFREVTSTSGNSITLSWAGYRYIPG